MRLSSRKVQITGVLVVSFAMLLWVGAAVVEMLVNRWVAS